MNVFIRYLKGLAVITYHTIPFMIYFLAVLFLYGACANTGWYAAAFLTGGLISLLVAITLTFLRGIAYFEATFQTKGKKSAAANKDKKNF